MGFCAPPNIIIDDTPINSMGFTGDLITIKKPNNTTRILTLGGSAFFNRRMSERLKTGLRKISEKKIELLGGALRAHNTKSSLIKYRYLSPYNFDYVIIYHNINDLDSNHVEKKDFTAGYSHIGPWYNRNFFLDNSTILRNVFNSYIYKNPPIKKMGSHYASVKTFSNNISSLVDLIKKDGAKPILMTFAWNIPKNYSYEAFMDKTVGYNNPKEYDRCPVELWGTPTYVAEGLKKHNAVILKLAAEKKVPLIDQEKLMGKDLFWFGDICHFSTEGTGKFIHNIVHFFKKNRLSLPL